jgi:signal transduction histidine kinase/CheY-like chemotaxis protein
MSTTRPATPDPNAWVLDGGGEMGELIRATDWATTSLGPMPGWSHSLKAVVAMMVHSRQPMFLWWGPELTQIYNDAYLPSFGAGKHPAAMGQPGRACWPEIWHIIGPQIDAVMQRGVPSWHEDALVPIFRNGALEDVYWTYGYSPVFDDDGSIGGTLVVCTETTGRVIATQAAELASRAKDDFLATASHELRTPLNAILGWAKMLQSGALATRDYQRAIDSIERNARAQVRLIEDILDGSRIITGNLHLEIRPLDLTALVQAALDAVRPAADAKRIELTVAIDPAASRVVGDPGRLQQVVWNLANNAIKFTPKDGRVDVSLQREGTDVELTVRDTGEGIAADFLPHVFERFRQAEGSTTRRHGGLGLGLALVRHLVEAHGGTVHAASEGPSRGATFRVRLPVQAVFAEPAAENAAGPDRERSSLPHPRRLNGVTVLVVDDEADARDLIATVLRSHGADVIAAANGSEAVALLASRSFSVMVSDIGMPQSDGYELIGRIRSATGVQGLQLPAIALTAYSRDEDRRRALESGFQAYVSKPVDPETLVRLVDRLAARRSTV